MTDAIEAAIASGALVPASAVAETRERCVQAVYDCQSFDEKTGLLCRKSDAVKAIRRLDITPACGDYVVVPCIPTQSMIQAGEEVFSASAKDNCATVWTAMLRRHQNRG